MAVPMASRFLSVRTGFSPGRTSNTSQCGARPPSVPPDITKATDAPTSSGDRPLACAIACPQDMGCETTGEVVDAAIAFGLAEHCHDPCRIDRPGAHCQEQCRHIVRRAGRQAMDISSHAGALMPAIANLRVAKIVRAAWRCRPASHMPNGNRLHSGVTDQILAIECRLARQLPAILKHGHHAVRSCSGGTTCARTPLYVPAQRAGRPSNWSGRYA